MKFTYFKRELSILHREVDEDKFDRQLKTGVKNRGPGWAGLLTQVLVVAVTVARRPFLYTN